MTIRVAINGFGRIGRQVFRILHARRDTFEVVAVNDLGRPEALAHLLKYDSTHGRFDGSLALVDGRIEVEGWSVPILGERDPAALPWKDLGHPLVVESTGVFRHRAQLGKHLDAGAAKVLLTVPPKDAVDALVVLGVNDEVLEPTHRLVSNASCTTNCLAPLAKVLHETFGIDHGLMSTIHGYTNDQRILDLEHKDLRRARSAAVNIIPTTTGAARAVGKVLPALAGKLDGFAVRVPVPDGSLVDLTAILAREATVEEVNGAMRAAAEGPLQGILRYCEDPIVSSDIIGDPASAIFDAQLTMAMGRTIKVCGWYDNEWGYSNRCVDLLARMAPVPQHA
jgi:glyceraldehyde 3-phosphate dehydrogenase